VKSAQEFQNLAALIRFEAVRAISTSAILPKIIAQSENGTDALNRDRCRHKPLRAS